MKSGSTTRLAAILFTDIVGYTAMMQQNREQAMHAVRFYESHLKDKIAQHEGELLQTYGDGSLSIFDSASAAVQCAKELQEAIRGEVALRIGIHLGEVTIDGEHIFGDGVNIASRVESMGVAGAVLVSSSIRQQIKNKPEFELESLGKFSFKNVAEPMTVYVLTNEGLSVPKPEEMRGKGEKLSAKNKTGPNSMIRMASIGFAAMIVGAVVFWARGSSNLGQVSLLNKDIREAKLAVSVFENRTGEENLHALGYLASEWISSGLRELKVRTVSAEMVRQNKDKIGILPNNPKGDPSFAEITGAKYVITGSYYLEEDSIILTTRLSSTETGEDIHTFPPIKGHKEYREKLVEEARQYLLGYWVLKRDQKLPNINPPKYEAYQIYLKCFITNIECLEEALEIDPNFSLARVWHLSVCSLSDVESLYDSAKSSLKRDLDQLAEYERNIYNYSNFSWQGNGQAAFEALNANYRLDSNDYNVAHQTAFLASASLNRTDIAIQIYKRMFENLDLFRDQVRFESFAQYTNVLNREGRYKEVIQFYQGLSEGQKVRAGNTAWEVMIALMNQGDMEEVWDIIEKKDNDKADLFRAAYMYAYLFPDAPFNPYADTLANRINELGEYPHNGLSTLRMRFWNSRYLAYYILKDWNQVERELKKLDDYNWQRYHQGFHPRADWAGHEKLWLAAAWACVYAHQGRSEEAYAKMKELEIAGRMYNDDTHVGFFRGGTAYLKARIYAVMGEKEKAVAELRKSINQGRLYVYWNITLDLDFVNLKGYPPFEALIAPQDGR